MFLKDLEDSVKQSMLNLALYVAEEDGDFSSDEKVLIEAYQKEMDFFEDAKKESLDSILNVLKNVSIIQRKQILFEIVGLCLADGKYDSTEEKLLKKVCEEFCIDEKHLPELVVIAKELNKIFIKVSIFFNQN